MIDKKGYTWLFDFAKARSSSYLCFWDNCKILDELYVELKSKSYYPQAVRRTHIQKVMGNKDLWELAQLKIGLRKCEKLKVITKLNVK